MLSCLFQRIKAELYKALLVAFCCESLFATSTDCDCGTIEDDPSYAQAVFLFKRALYQTIFPGADAFPKHANRLYPPRENRALGRDGYPPEGVIYWETGVEYYFHRKAWENRPETHDYYTQKGDRYTDPDQIRIPRRVSRIVKWSDWPNHDDRYEHKEKTIFVFKKNYATILDAFQALKTDITRYYKSSDLFLAARITDLANDISVYEWGGMGERRATAKSIIEKQQKLRSTYEQLLNTVEKYETGAILACITSLDWCIKHHRTLSAYVNRGLFHYLKGHSLDAFDQVVLALENCDTNCPAQLREQALFLKGQTELETGLYANAIITLSDLIERNPQYKEAYIERAHAFFELGHFDLSIQDYITSGIKTPTVSGDSLELFAFGFGLTKGLVAGGAQAGIQFIPSALSSLNGIAHGLWAFALDPVAMSSAFVEGAQSCILFIRDHTPKEALIQLIPELQNLIEQWDHLKEEQKGVLTGQIIGQYGIDIFAGMGLTKAMKAYRSLKRANNLLTFEAMALSERNLITIGSQIEKRIEARERLLRHPNLKIQWDKQGKHIVGHKNYTTLLKKSVLEHSDPQKLVNTFAGKGIKIGHIQPGTAGYQELVNFGEHIGYAIERDTGKTIITSWGKIHYAQDGVHIVPTKPR